MKFVGGILFILLAWIPALLVGQTVGHSSEPPTKNTLICYVCYSTISWKDCEDKQNATYCDPKQDEVCVNIRLTKWTNQNGPQITITQYAKYCSVACSCSDKECKELGYRCDVECCHKDYCNTAVTSVSALSLPSISTLSLPSIILTVQCFVLSTNGG